MVRFIIQFEINPIESYLDLHSNMVRFIILALLEYKLDTLIFTFQYG